MGMCFLIGPYGAEASKERLWSDFVLNNIVKPACGEQFRAQRTIDDPNLDPSGTINSQILEALDAADIVCADLTDHNANAFYELGIRHARGKPFILVCRRDTKLPFDVQAYPTIILQAKFVDELNIFAMADEAKEAAVRTLSERIKSLAPRLAEAHDDSVRSPTSQSHIFKFYKWTTQYSVTIARDWLAKQPEPFQQAVAAYEANEGDAGIQKADELRFLEYLVLKGSANKTYNGKLWCIVNRANHSIEAGYAVYEFAEGPMVIDVSGTHAIDKEQIALTFDQPGRPVSIGRFHGDLPAYSYTVEFSRPRGAAFAGVLNHPDTGTLIGRARLNAAYGF
jgi:nucleoside 2-deoxyribosyltransferase